MEMILAVAIGVGVAERRGPVHEHEGGDEEHREDETADGRDPRRGTRARRHRLHGTSRSAFRPWQGGSRPGTVGPSS